MLGLAFIELQRLFKLLRLSFGRFLLFGKFRIPYFHEIATDSYETPGIRLTRLKFDLTNQDSAGGKNYTVLNSM